MVRILLTGYSSRSSVIIGLNFQQIGKNPGFSSRPVIFRKNPGVSPTSRGNPGFAFGPEKFVGSRRLGYIYIYTLYHKPEKTTGLKRNIIFQRPSFSGSMFGLTAGCIMLIANSGLYLRSPSGPGWWKKSTSVFRYQVFFTKISRTWWFKVTFLGWLSDPFKWLSDLQLGDQKVTLNHLGFVFFFLFWGDFFFEGGVMTFVYFCYWKSWFIALKKKTNLYKVINSIVSHSYIYGLIPSKMYDGTKSQRTPGWPAAGGPRLARAAFGTRETLKRNVLRGHGVVVWWSLGIFGGNEWKRSDEILEYHRTPEIIYS